MKVVVHVATVVVVLSWMSGCGNEGRAEPLFCQRDVLSEGEAPVPTFLDSLNVSVVGRWPFGPASAVCVEGNYTYLGSGGGIYVVDTSSPSNPTKVKDGSGRKVPPGIYMYRLAAGDSLVTKKMVVLR